MQAPPYNRSKNFTENNPDRTDHASLNAELDKISVSVNELRENAAKIQKDDGTLSESIISIENIKPETIQLLKVPGQPGKDGKDGKDGENWPVVNDELGPWFKVDARDLLANRGFYGQAKKGFSFLALDVGQLFLKLSDAVDDWSTGFPFGKGEKGDTVVGPIGPPGVGTRGPMGPPGQGIPGIDGIVTNIDTTLKTASLIGRSSVNARLVINNGVLSIVLTTS